MLLKCVRSEHRRVGLRLALAHAIPPKIVASNQRFEPGRDPSYATYAVGVLGAYQ